MLIDSEQLKLYFSWWSDEPNKELFCEIIDRQPEAVVRCKSCRFFRKTFKPEYGEERYTCGNIDAMLNPDPDDFCSRSSRRSCLDCKHQRTIEQNEWLDTKCVRDPENKRSVSLTDYCDKWEAR